MSIFSSLNVCLFLECVWLVLIVYRHGQLKCVELLLSRGSEVTMDNDGLTPLEICVQVRE